MRAWVAKWMIMPLESVGWREKILWFGESGTTVRMKCSSVRECKCVRVLSCSKTRPGAEGSEKAGMLWR